MRILRTIILAVIAALCLSAAILLTVEGNLSALLGYTGFYKGERLFPYSRDEVNEITWMRIEDNQSRAECSRLPNGIWWMTSPWNDRMDPRAAAAILQFTYSTSIVDALPMNNTVKASMREFGVETTPVHITLKKAEFDGSKATTLARYTLGSTAPWLVDSGGEAEPDATTYMRSDFYGHNNRILVCTGNILPLFKNSINQLRDHRPLILPANPSAILPTQPREIMISHNGKKVHLYRDSFADPWVIKEPLAIMGNQENVIKLIITLQQLTASRVYDPADWLLPELPESELTRITLWTFASQEPVTLTIYPPDSQASTTARATVSDRKAVFDIPVKANEFLPGVKSLPLALSELRTPYLAELNRTELDAVTINSKHSEYPFILRLLEGDRYQSTETKWMFKAEGMNFTKANEKTLFDFLKAIISLPVKDFVTDSPGDLDIYGLKDPEYILMFVYKQHEIGENEEKTIESLPPQTILIGRGASGDWYAMEEGKPSVYQIGLDFLKVIKTDHASWLPDKLLNFARANLKSLDLTRTGEPTLRLNYEHLDDSWTATKDGKDETARINPIRARNYLTGLEKLRVQRWLPYTDQEAAEALKNPVFTLTINLEEQSGEDELMPIIPEDDNTFTPLDVPKENIVKRTITIQIAPAGELGVSRYYYGKISDSPYFYILDMSEVKLLGASVYEQ